MKAGLISIKSLISKYNKRNFENFDVFSAHLSYFQMGRRSLLTKHNQSISETVVSKLN